MKKISHEDYLKLDLMMSSNQKTEFHDNVISLALGEHLFIAKGEWKRKSSVSSVVSQIATYSKDQRKYKTARLMDGTGYVISRIN